jgi:hypothetical protein
MGYAIGADYGGGARTARRAASSMAASKNADAREAPQTKRTKYAAKSAPAAGMRGAKIDRRA